MALITKKDFIDSITDALQYIACYHSKDFIDAMSTAYEKEKSPAAKDAIAQILINSRMCAEDQRPICQDTGIVNVFIKVGMSVHWDSDQSIEDMVNEGVRRAYTHPDNSTLMHRSWFAKTENNLLANHPICPSRPKAL